MRVPLILTGVIDSIMLLNGICEKIEQASGEIYEKGHITDNSKDINRGLFKEERKTINRYIKKEGKMLLSVLSMQYNVLEEINHIA